MLEIVYQSTVFQTIVVGLVVLVLLRLLKPTFIYDNDGNYKSTFVTSEIIALVSAALFYVLKSWITPSSLPSQPSTTHHKSKHQRMRYGKDEFASKGYGNELLNPEEFYN